MLISNLKSIFLRPEPETLDNPENLQFPNYREFPVPVDKNGYRIYIVQVKELLYCISSVRNSYPEHSG